MATRPIEELVTDRTARDVQLLNNKGNYNATDLNRVEEWCKYLSDLLKEYGYYNSIVTKTDWEIGLGKQNQTSEINRIKNNLQKLKDAFYEIAGTPEVPSTDRLAINYQEANNMEKIMVDLEIALGKLESAFRYADFLYAGDDTGMPNTINEEE